MARAAWVHVHDLRATGVVRTALAIARRLGRDRPTTLVAGFRHGFLLDEAAIVRRERRVRVAILGGGTADAAADLRARADAAGLGEGLLPAGETDDVFAWNARRCSPCRRVGRGRRWRCWRRWRRARRWWRRVKRTTRHMCWGRDGTGCSPTRAAAFSLEAACDRYAAIAARLRGEQAGEDREPA